MKLPGNNTLIINQATMQKAMEYWLKNSVWGVNGEYPQVTNVTADTGAYKNGFQIQLCSPTTEKKPDGE